MAPSSEEKEENTIVDRRETKCRKVTELLILLIDSSYVGAAAHLIYMQLLASPFARSHTRMEVCKKSHKRPLSNTPPLFNTL
jgi:hypothetical protein